ncbi:MAG: DUF3365 domain-containing protein [Thiotrichales bacterium]|nr:DUF3365 domain-containing protein [Thiotrichales bacterium]
MKKSVLSILLAGLTLNVQASEPHPANLEARSIVKEFGGQLQPALQAAMKAGGPVAAIDVCQTKAPAIAKDLSAKHAWNVNRVSLKPRGATATPDAWETATLKWFDEQIAAGVDPKTLEKFEIVKADGAETIRYMKPVMTAGLCLTCHGSEQQIPAPVKAKLAEVYPNDTAIGYQEGNVRGAFSFQKAAQ